jgi:hypothetical protein
MKATSRVVVSQSPDWTQHPQHPGQPEMLRLQFGMPEGGRLSTDKITISVWDRDVADEDDVVGVALLSMKELRGNPQKWQRPFWINFYGAPESIGATAVLGSMFGKLVGQLAGGGDASQQRGGGTRATDVQRLMNSGKLDGCLYRGRVLVAVSIRPKGLEPVSGPIRMEPPLSQWLLVVKLYEASDLPFDCDAKVELRVGSHKVVTERRLDIAGQGGCRAQWYQTAYLTMDYPDDLAQLPDVFVNLCKGDKRTSYKRFQAKALNCFRDMWPEWEHLKRDPFGPLSKKDYPGTLFMAIGLGREAEYRELQQLQDKPRNDWNELERQRKKDEKNRQKHMLFAEERLQVSKCIANRKSQPKSFKELSQRVDPLLPSMDQLNSFWLKNAEMIVDQVPINELNGGKEAGKLGKKLKTVLDKAARARQNASRDAAAAHSDSDSDDDVLLTPSTGKRGAGDSEAWEKWAQKATHEEDVMVKQLQSKLNPSESVLNAESDKKEEDFIFVSEYEEIWNDESSGAADDGSIWRPVIGSSMKNFAACGDVVSSDRIKPKYSTIAITTKNPTVAKKCTGFRQVWTPKKAGDARQAMAKPVQLWEPIPPPGYHRIGFVAWTKRDVRPTPEDLPVMCVKEEWLETVEELALAWSTKGGNFDKSIGLWNVPGINTFFVKREQVRREKYEQRPPVQHRIQLKLLPTRPGTTKKEHMSMTGMLECKRSSSSGIGGVFNSGGGGIGGVFGFAGIGGKWEQGWYTLNYEALTQYASEAVHDVHKLPRSTLFVNPQIQRKVNRIKQVKKLQEDWFELEVTTRGDARETWSFKAPSPSDAAEWYRVIQAHFRAWSGEDETRGDVKSALELRADIKSDKAKFKLSDSQYSSLWNSDGSPARTELSVWRPICEETQVWFGDLAQEGLQKPTRGMLIAEHLTTPDEHVRVFKTPDDFELVAHMTLKKPPWEGLWLWQPKAYKQEIGQETIEYVHLGLVATVTKDKPAISKPAMSKLRCINKDFVDSASEHLKLRSIWDDRSTTGMLFKKKETLQIWAAPGGLRMFYASESPRQPLHTDVYALKPFLAPEAAEGASCAFVDMTEFRHSYLLIKNLPKMMLTSDIEAELEYFIGNRKDGRPITMLKTERIQFDPMDDHPIYQSARVYFTPSDPESAIDKDEQFRNLLEDLPKTGNYSQSSVQNGLVFDCDYELRVHIYMGRNLPAADDDGQSDPFVKASCAGEWGKREQHYRSDDPCTDKLDQTAAKRGTVNPQWYETLHFRNKGCLKGLPRFDRGRLELPDDLEVWPKLTLHVFDWDEGSKDEFLGRVTINLEDIASCMYHCTTPRWHKVHQAQTEIASGELLVSCQLIPMEITSRERLNKLGRPRLKYHCQGDLKEGVASFEKSAKIKVAKHTKRRNLIDDLLKQVVNQRIVEPQMMDCTVEVLLLGCRDLRGHNQPTPNAPNVRIDLGDPTNVRDSKSSAQPNGCNPNFGEVLKLKARIPQDPLFAPTLSVQVIDSGGRGRPTVLGKGSILLLPGVHLPKWEAWAGAIIVKMRRGQLDRRKFQQLKTIANLRRHFRTKSFMRKFRNILIKLWQQETVKGIPGKKKFSKRDIDRKDKLLFGTAPTISRDSGRNCRARKRSTPAPEPETEPIPESEVPTGAAYHGYRTRKSTVESIVIKKDASGRRKPKRVEEKGVPTYHGRLLQPTAGDIAEKPVKPKGVPLELPEPVSTTECKQTSSCTCQKCLSFGEEAPVDMWRWYPKPTRRSRFEYKSELEKVKLDDKNDKTEFQPLFETFPLFKGSEIGGGGFLSSFTGATSREEAGCIKAIIRVVDESPAIIESSNGSRENQKEEIQVMLKAFEEAELSTELSTKKYDFEAKPIKVAKSGVHKSECVCPECCQTIMQRLYARRALFPNYRIGTALLETGGADQSWKRHDLVAKKEDVVVEILNLKGWRFGYNDTNLQRIFDLPEGQFKRVRKFLDACVQEQISKSIAPLLPDKVTEAEAFHLEPPGTLEVKIFNAKNLRDVEMFGSMSPYIKVIVCEDVVSGIRKGKEQSVDIEMDDASFDEDHISKTRIKFRNGGANVHFDGEVLTLAVEKYDKCLLIQAWDHEEWKDDDFIGHAAVKLDDLFKKHRGQWPPLDGQDSEHPGGRIKLYSDIQKRQFAGEIELQIVFKEAKYSQDDEPRRPLKPQETQTALKLVALAAKRRLEELERSIPRSIEPPESTSKLVSKDLKEELSRTRMWGQFLPSQVTLHSLDNLLDPEETDANWTHVWPNGHNDFPSLTWSFPPGNFCACAAYSITAAADSAGKKSRFTSPRSWRLLGANRNNATPPLGQPSQSLPGTDSKDESTLPDHSSQWDTLSSVSRDMYRRSALVPRKSKKSKRGNRVSDASDVDSRLQARFEVRAPEPQDLVRAWQDLPHVEFQKQQAKEMHTKSKDANRKKTPQDQKKEEEKWQQQLLKSCLNHIEKLAGTRPPTGHKISPTFDELLKILQQGPSARGQGKSCQQVHVDLKALLMEAGEWGYTSKECQEQLEHRPFRDARDEFLEEKLVEAWKQAGVDIESKPVKGIDVRRCIMQLTRDGDASLVGMPGLWFQLMALSWKFASIQSGRGSSAVSTLRQDVEKVLQQLAKSGSGVTPDNNEDDIATGLAFSLDARAPFDGPHLQMTDSQRRTKAYEFRALHIASDSYKDVRKSLRKRFSGETVRAVEFEYFQDELRAAQAIVIDLATVVHRMPKERMLDVFHMAKISCGRFNLTPTPGPKRDEEKKRMKAEPLLRTRKYPEVQTLLRMLGFHVNRPTFEEVIRMVDTSGDGRIGYDEMCFNIKQTKEKTESALGEIMFFEVKAMMRRLTSRLRTKPYRFLRLELTEKVDRSKSFVQLGGIQLHRAAQPWGEQQPLPDVDSPAEGEQEDAMPILQLMQPQDVVVRAYVIEARGLMPKDDDGLANSYVITSLDGQELGSSKDSRHSLEPQLRVVHEFPPTKLPGPSQLKMTLWDDDLIGRDEMGSTTVDLEDRWFCEQWRRSGSDGYKPIEWRPLHLKGRSTEQGRLRMWIDILPVATVALQPKIDIRRQGGIPFQLRVIIWSAKDLPAMDRMSGSNDAYVIGRLVGVNDDNEQSPYFEERQTDVHWRAKSKSSAGSIFSCPPSCRAILRTLWACFKFCCLCCCKKEDAPTDVRTDAAWNWRFLYDVKLPMKECRFYLQAWDKDVVSGDGGDLIGGAVDTENGRFLDILENGARPRNLGFEDMNSFFAKAEANYRRHELKQKKLTEAKNKRRLTDEEERALTSLDALILHRPGDTASRKKRAEAQRGGSRGGAVDPTKRASGFIKLSRMHKGKREP